MSNTLRRWKRGDMVKCTYAPNEQCVAEFIGYEPGGEVKVILSITRKRTKTVEKVETVVKESAIEPLSLLYFEEDDEQEEVES